MLRLLTLGGAAVVDDSGAAPGAAASQRRTLALLSVLAVSGDTGLSRDKLVGLFWPEADGERGRHALTQALYAARRGLGCDDLFIVGADVRLNPERISSDIADFEDALHADPEYAVTLYRGAFLDGFFLPGADEFERWTSEHRARFEAHALRALERLASDAQAAGDARHAAEWWRRAAVLRPLDSGIAVRYMESLAAGGDRARALQHAAVHRSLLRAELDLEPDASVAECERALRERPTADEPRPFADDRAPDESRRALAPIAPNADDDAHGSDLPTPAGTSSVSGARVIETGFAASPMSHPVQVWTPAGRRIRSWRRPALLLGLVVIAAIAVVVGRTWSAKPPLKALAVPQAVVVAPFRVAGASSALHYLRDGMVELLSTRLADDSAAPSVDAGAVIGAWRAAGLAASMDVPRDTIVRLATTLGAKRVVVGGIVGTPQTFVVHATVLRVPDGAVAAQATVRGSADSITSVVDQLAARLLLAEAGVDEGLARHMTASLSALRAFLSGQAALRANDYATAIRYYQRSLARDSTFALAALRLAITADRVDDSRLERRGLRLAWLFRDQLVDRDRELLAAFTGAGFPAPPAARALMAAWQRTADLAPASTDASLVVGARLFHEGAVVGLPAATDWARGALDRALVADSTDPTAARLLVQMAAASGDTRPLPGHALQVATTDALDPFAPFVRWYVAATRGDTAALATARGGLRHMGPANLRLVALASQYDAVSVRDGARALSELRQRHAETAGRVDALLAAHALALNAGQLRTAATTATDLRTMLPGAHAGLRLAVLDALYGDGDREAAGAAAEQLGELAVSVNADSVAPDATRAADLCVLGQWWLATARSTAVPGVIAELRRARADVDVVPVGPAAPACAALLDASLAVGTRRPDARARVAALDSLAFTSEAAGDAALYAPLWLARLHERLGDQRGALRALRRRPYMADWPRYQASTLREEGRLAAATGDAAGARAAYARYLALRTDPDSALAAQTDSVRAALARLGG